MLTNTDDNDGVVQDDLTRRALSKAMNEGQDLSEEEVKQNDGPTYKVFADSKIAVSKARGKMWSARLATGMKYMSTYKDNWDEAIRYYNNDQSSHREGDQRAGGDSVGNQILAKRMNNQLTQTENLIYANVNSMVPQLYAKNPIVEVSPVRPGDQVKDDFCDLCERLIDRINHKRNSPGINLKPKARKGVLVTLLTNRVFMEIGWTQKDQSSEKALEDLATLSKQLQEAKTTQEIEKIEGELQALEMSVDFLLPSGPYARLRLPQFVVVDPDAEENDFSDANWTMIEDYLSTDFLNARYGERDEKNQVKSIYKPSHILQSKDSPDENIDSEKLFSYDGRSMADYGFTDRQAFDKAKRTKVWYVWDKVTRRMELYADGDWVWPIWVWDDPYHLDRFFPLYELNFHMNPISPLSKGAVSYSLDQQDAINEINDTQRRGREWAKRNVIYDKTTMKQDDVDKLLSGPNGTAKGIDIPEGKKLTDMIQTLPTPDVAYLSTPLFDKQAMIESMDRILGTSEISRGGQFKTNTTNQAIQTYTSISNTRYDERVDSVEDWIGEIDWGVIQLCLQNMDAETVGQMVGYDVSDVWKRMTSDEIERSMNVTVVGGSTNKPTSQVKKQEAMQIGQLLGQFVKAAPPVVLLMLKVFERSFDGFVITSEEWKTIEQSVAQSLQQDAGSSGGGSAAGGEPTQGSDTQGGDIEAQLKSAPPQVQEMIKSMPPQAKEALVQMLQKGVPLQTAIQELSKSTQGDSSNG